MGMRDSSLRWQYGRSMELPALVALAGLSIAIGVGTKSWLWGIAALVLIPFSLFAVSWFIETVDRLVTLLRARSELRRPATRLYAATRLHDAAFALKDQRWIADRAAVLLRRALDDDDTEVRLRAACGLARLGRHPDVAVVPLIDALRQREQRSAALDALRLLGAHAQPAVPALASLAEDTRSSEWWRVVVTLQAIGPGARAAAPVLTAALDRVASDEIEWPIRALAAVGDREAVPALDRLAKTGKDERVRDAARKALAQIGSAEAGRST